MCTGAPAPAPKEGDNAAVMGATRLGHCQGRHRPQLEEGEHTHSVGTRTCTGGQAPAVREGSEGRGGPAGHHHLRGRGCRSSLQGRLGHRRQGVHEAQDCTQSKALQYMCFAQRACSKVPSLSEASASQLCRHHRLWAHGRQHRDVLRGARRHRREEPQAMNVIMRRCSQGRPVPGQHDSLDHVRCPGPGQHRHRGRLREHGT